MSAGGRISPTAMSAGGSPGHHHGIHVGHGDRATRAEAMKIAQDVKSMDPETLKSHVRRLNDATPISWQIEWKKAHKESDERKKPYRLITDQLSATSYQNSVYLKNEETLRRHAERKLHTKFMLQVDSTHRHPQPWNVSHHIHPYGRWGGDAAPPNDKYAESDSVAATRQESDDIAGARPYTTLGVSRSRPELTPLPSPMRSVRSQAGSRGLFSQAGSRAELGTENSVHGGLSSESEPWVRLQMDRDFGPASVHNMKPMSRERFTHHLHGRVEQIKQEYEWVPGDTVSQSTFKAQLGADLFEMRRCLWRMQDTEEPDAKSIAEGTYQGD